MALSSDAQRMVDRLTAEGVRDLEDLSRLAEEKGVNPSELLSIARWESSAQ